MAKYLKCTTNKPAVSYKCGEKIVFTVQAKENRFDTPYDFIKWSVRGDDGKFMTDVFAYDNGKPLVIETTLDKPGYVHLWAQVHLKNSVIDPSFDVLDAGAGADIEKLEYCDTIPEDFDSYWADIERMVEEHTPEILYKEELKADVPVGFKAYDIRVSVPCEGRPASMILTYPENGDKFSLKAIYQGYSISPSYKNYIENTLTVTVNAHGIENDIPRVVAETKYNKELSNYGFNREENKSNMKTYWRNVMIRDLVALKFAKSLPLWNGKGVTVAGGSQGAFQATTMAAHDKDVTFLDINIPWFCNLNAESHGFMEGWRPKFDEGLRYFDTAAQASRVKCPVMINAKLGDYVCPPSTTTTLYNMFNCVKAMDLAQSGTHPYNPPESEKFRLRFDPSNPMCEIKLGKYRHYKGGEYEVIGIGKDSENLEATVIYRSTENGEIWVRPKWMFEEYVNIDGIPTKRFEYLG